MTPETKARTILIADDEPDILEIINYNLQAEGYEVITAKNGNEAIELAKRNKPDLIILDVMMPGKTGFEVCKILRALPSFQETVIIFLTALNDDSTQIKGLETGGDDYLTKPFNLEELLLRIEKLVVKNRRLQERNNAPDIYSFGKCKIDFSAQTGKDKDGKAIELSKKELALLKLLIEHKNEVVSREHILQAVWGYNVYPTTRTIDNFILNFRKYFEKDSRNPRHFHSVRGVGYKFTE